MLRKYRKAKKSLKEYIRVFVSAQRAVGSWDREAKCSRGGTVIPGALGPGEAWAMASWRDRPTVPDRSIANLSWLASIQPSDIVNRHLVIKRIIILFLLIRGCRLPALAVPQPGAAGREQDQEVKAAFQD